jgi:hypothetical protein
MAPKTRPRDWALVIAYILVAVIGSGIIILATLRDIALLKLLFGG